MTTTTASTFSFGLIDDNIGTKLTDKEESLNSYLTTLDGDITSGDLLGLQRQIAEWSLCVDIQATLSKTLSDTMKGVVQKSG